MDEISFLTKEDYYEKVSWIYVQSRKYFFFFLSIHCA